MISLPSLKHFKYKHCLFAASLLVCHPLHAAESDYPVYVEQLPNPNDYMLFANGGWDGNWFVGYRNAWVKKLPAPPKRSYARAYLGAKLGRAKTLPPVGRPPEFKPVPGEVWAAISSTTTWPVKQQVKLTSSEDIPLEPSFEYALEHVGESQWYWAEIPLESVNFDGDNFIAVWSPSPSFVSIASAPVLAAGWGGKDAAAWLVENVKGEPPKDPTLPASKVLSFFHPAIALKLIPSGSSHHLKVRVESWQNGTADQPKPVLTVAVEGESVQRVWIERNEPIRRGDVIRGNWVPIGRSLWKAPYIFSIDQAKLPKGKLLIRAAASNIWEEKVFGQHFEIEVGEPRGK